MGEFSASRCLLSLTPSPFSRDHASGPAGAAFLRALAARFVSFRLWPAKKAAKKASSSRHQVKVKVKVKAKAKVNVAHVKYAQNSA